MAFADEVGATKGCQQGDAGAERGVLVTGQSVARECRRVDVTVSRSLTAHEESTAVRIREGGKTETKDDCCCDY